MLYLFLILSLQSLLEYYGSRSGGVENDNTTVNPSSQKDIDESILEALTDDSFEDLRD